MNNESRNSRRKFRKTYSPEAFQVIKYVSRGWDTPRIASKVGITETSVAAYRANLTRGTYHPYADFGNDSVVYGDMFLK